jgi:outer membrane protein OmpA-like peptidoglycan-associated protein
MARFSPPLLVGSAALLALTACAPTPGGNPDDFQRTRTGAVAGGLLGAVTGALVAGEDDRLAGAAIGAAAGAAGGAVIGNILDKQARELRQSLDSRVQIINTGNELIVRMPQNLLFAVDRADLRPDLQADLRELAASLQRYPGTTVEVVGHTDSDGAADYNQRLSERRANSVAQVLQVNGVSPGRIVAYGRGEQDPIADNLTDAGKAQNRRVDITIRPN